MNDFQMLEMRDVVRKGLHRLRTVQTEADWTAIAEAEDVLVDSIVRQCPNANTTYAALTKIDTYNTIPLPPESISHPICHYSCYTMALVPGEEVVGASPVCQLRQLVSNWLQPAILAQRNTGGRVLGYGTLNWSVAPAEIHAPASPHAQSSPDGRDQLDPPRPSTVGGIYPSLDRCRADIRDTRQPIKFGDHSVTTPDVLPEVVAATPPTSTQFDIGMVGLCNYIIRSKPDAISWVTADHTWRVNSDVSRPFGKVRVQNVAADVSHMRLIDTDESIHVSCVRWGESVTVEDHIAGVPLVPDTALNAFARARTMQPLITQYFRCHRAAASIASSYIYRPFTYRVSNVGLYAKLAYNVLMSCIQQDSQYALAALPTAYADPPDRVNLAVTEEVTDSARRITSLGNSEFIFVEHMDFYRGEETYIYQMASTTRMYAAALGNWTPAGSGWAWPKVPVLIVYDDPEQVLLPPEPVPARLDASCLRRWLFDLARRRGELDAAHAGWYAACHIVGGEWVQYTYPATDEVAPEGDREAIPARPRRVLNVPTTTFQEGNGSHELPRPGDYDLIARYKTADTRPATSDSIWLDKQCMRQPDALVTCRSTLLMAALTQVACTTVWYSNSVTATMQQDALMGHYPFPHFHYFCMRFLYRSKTLPIIFIKANQLCHDIYGATHPSSAFDTRGWCSSSPTIPAGYEPDTAGFRWLLDPNRTYQPIQCLAITKWLQAIPAEWGLTGLQPTYNFSSEVRRFGPVERQGWESYAGDRTYDERAKMGMPHACVPYGMMALNVITQHFALGEAPPIDMQTFTVTEHGLFPFQAPHPIPIPVDEQPEYNIEMNWFNPCRFVTYRWSHQEIRAIGIHGSAVEGIMHQLSYSRSMMSSTAGVVLRFPYGSMELRNLIGFSISNLPSIYAATDPAPLKAVTCKHEARFQTLKMEM